MKVALVSCYDYENYSIGYEDEESHLLDFLLKKGLDITRKEWNDDTVDWKQYDLAILKSPWDYHEHYEPFHKWLDTLHTLHVRLLNPVDTIKWNSDKHYLKDISDTGMRVTPTLFMERGSNPDLLPYFNELQADKIIIKPCRSAGAKKIFTVTRDDISNMEATIYRLLADESYIVQPFMEEIFNGEWSLIFFNGKFSHSILNVPGNGDFRVQHYHGGSTKPAKADTATIENASACVKQFANNTLYARVDGIISKGQFYLMELELTEPYLYLYTDPPSYERYYAALLELVTPPLTDICRK